MQSGDETTGLTEFLGRPSTWAAWGLGPLTAPRPQQQGWSAFSRGKGPALLRLFIHTYSGHTCRALPPAAPWREFPSALGILWLTFDPITLVTLGTLPGETFPTPDTHSQKFDSPISYSPEVREESVAGEAWARVGGTLPFIKQLGGRQLWPPTGKREEEMSSCLQNHQARGLTPPFCCPQVSTLCPGNRLKTNPRGQRPTHQVTKARS